MNLPVKAPDKAVQPYVSLAEKIGWVLAGLTEGSIGEITIEYEGPLAEYDISLLSVGVLKGLLSPIVSVPLSYVNTTAVCKERGLEFKEVKSQRSKNYLNLIRVSGHRSDGSSISVAATRHDPDQDRLVEVNGYEVDITPSEFMGYFRYEDKPGVIGQVGVILGEAGINIGSMQVGRRAVQGEAAMLISVDSPISDELIQNIKDHVHMKEARVLHIG